VFFGGTKIQVGPCVEEVGAVDQFVIGKIIATNSVLNRGSEVPGYFIIDTSRHKLIDGLTRDAVSEILSSSGKDSDMKRIKGYRNLSQPSADLTQLISPD
jgi:hypothetical protein